jgi:2-oxoglutarate/2-oxoacid ferredoxin oxidoreductase subunit alpha
MEKISRTNRGYSQDFLCKRLQEIFMDDSGISQRVLPGQSEGVLYADSKEYNEAGHTTESGDVRKQMMKKRKRNLDGVRREMGQPEIYPWETSGNPDV